MLNLLFEHWDPVNKLDWGVGGNEMKGQFCFHVHEQAVFAYN